MRRGAATALMIAIMGIAPLVAADDFARCRELVKERSEDVESWLCFRSVGRGSGDLAGAVRELGALEAIHGPGAELSLARGAILADLADGRSGAELEAAADGCRAKRAARCEVLARLELSAVRSRWDPDGARVEQDRAAAVAARAGSPDLILRCRVAAAVRDLNDDRPAETIDELEVLRDEVGDAADDDTVAAVLEGLGVSAWAIGRLAESRDLFADLLALAETTSDAWLRARASASHTLLDLIIESPPPESVRNRVEELVSAAHDASNPIAEIKLRVILAQTLGPAAAQREWRTVERMSRSHGAVEDELLALRMLARTLMRDGDPAGAIETMDRAQEVAYGAVLRDAEIRSCAGALEMCWADGRLAEARGRVEGCLELIDRYRDRQELPVDRVRAASRFSHIPRHIIDALLTFEGDVAEAMRVRERMASISLGAVRSAPPETAALDELRGRLVAVQRELAYTRPAAGRRAELERELQLLETRERELMRAVAQPESPAAAVPDLSQIQEVLGDGETLLAFTVIERPTTFWQTTGAWAMVVTADNTRAVRLPPFSEVGPAVDAFAGLLGRSDESGRSAAARLHRLLLGEIPELARTRRLLVIADEPLHNLPLTALRPSPEAPPLVAAMDVELLPSAAALLRWRRSAGRSGPMGPPVVVASPALAAGSDAATRSADLPSVAELGRLPGAALEGDRVSRLLGPGTRLMAAGGASEAALRTAAAGRPSVLHIAAHAVVDNRRPGRSAVVLAPGGGHDGLLQERDIAELPLDGTLVVLSACRSLAGEVVDGGGVVSLGRAFLDAGAGAVVGATRPLDDRSVADLMLELYRGLAGGATVSHALARAQARAAAAGRPPAEWATVLLFGNGSLTVDRPAAPKSASRLQNQLTTAVAASAVVAMLVVLLARWRWPRS